MEKSELRERVTFLKGMIDKRGYVLDFHKIMASEDFEFLQEFERLFGFSLKERRLTRKTKELILVAVLCAIRSEPHHIAAHIKAAMNHGAIKEEILEAIELILPPSGVVSFMRGIDVLKETIPLTRIEPDGQEGT